MDRLPMRLYIAEPSASMLQRLIELAEDGGVAVVGIASSAACAIQEIAALKPDCVILNFSLTGGTALEVLTAFPPQDRVGKFVVLSQYPYYRECCLSAGADWFFDPARDYPAFVGLLHSLSTVRQEMREGLL